MIYFNFASLSPFGEGRSEVADLVTKAIKRSETLKINQTQRYKKNRLIMF
jgi:hypothetical protein